MILPAITEHVVGPLPGWWTDADAAEWARFTHELALGSIEHLERCPDCASCWPCDRLARGFVLADEWLASRRAESKADYLRAQLEERRAA